MKVCFHNWGFEIYIYISMISLEVVIMNKTFKVIWSKARNAYIVVSELAKNYCRASKTVAAAVMVSVLAGTMAASPAWGAVTEHSSKNYTVVTGTIKTMKDDHDNPTATPTYTTADMAIGSNSVAKGDKSTAIGNNSKVDGDYSIAIGNTSMVVDGSSSVAIGNHSTATGAATTVIGAQASGVAGATVIGMNSEATGIDSVAIGVLSNVHNGGGVAIGRNAVNDIDPGDGGSKPGVSIGDTSKAYGQSIAIGAVANALGSYSIAIGASANASGSYSIALGEGAEVKEKSECSSVFGTSAKIAENSKYSVVSGAYSKIGEDAQYSTLVGANSSIGSSSSLSTLIGGYAKIGTNSDASILMGPNGNIKDNAYGSTAIGYNTMVESKAYYSTVIGYESKATQNIWDGTALGRESKVSVDEGVALGSYSIASTAEGEAGYDALTGENSTDESITWKATSAAVSVGGRVTTSSGYKDVTRQITNVAAGTQDTDAVNVAQLKRAMEKANKGWKLSTEGGAANQVASEATVDFSGKKDAGNHQNITVSNDGNNVKIDLASELHNVTGVVNGDSSVTLEMNTAGISNGTAQMTIRGDSITLSKGVQGSVQIHGVAAGTADTDAVNYGQLKDVKAEAGKHTTLSNGKNTTVTSTNKDGQIDYQVNVAGDLKDITSVANGDSKIKLNKDSISISNGNKSFAITNSGIDMSYITADYSAKSIMLDENGTTISGGLNVAGSKITGVATGVADTDAVNVGQLNAVKETANKGWKLKTNNGNVSDVKPGDEVEFDGDDNIKVSNAGNKVSFKLNNKLTGIESIAGVGGSISFSGGNVTINNNVTFGSNGQIHNVTAGTASTDAVNVGQLNAAVQAGNTDTHIKPGEYGVGADNKVNMDVVDKTGTKINTVTITDVAKASDLGNVNNINNDLKNSNGTTTVVDAVNNLNQKLDNKVGDLQYSKVDKGDIADGDSTTTAIGKLDQALKDVADTANQGWNLSTNGGEASKVAPGKTVDFSGDKNIKISNDGTNVKVELNKDLTGLNSVTSKEANIGGVSIKNNIVDNLSNKEWDAKNTDQYKDSGKAATEAQLQQAMSGTVQYDRKDDGTVNKTQITLNKEGDTYTTITNVANGKVKKDSKDAINGGQLFDTETKINNRIDGVENQVISNSNRIGQLSSRVNKVGAGAAALAALHPMDFDPDDKLTFSAGYGNYAGENAAAIGAYYRPDEKVMFSVAGTVGNGENMVNAGVSFALDRTNHVSNSRTALAREVIDLRGQLAVMGAKMAKMEKAFGMLDETKTKLFPDVPANHWAYEYIAKLAGNGYIEGYPDGNFGGDRLMTRYEFAAVLYRAIENGAALEEKIIKEFEPELGRIRVDRISGEDGDRDKIERVRVNDTKGERDHYGNKLAK